LSVSTISDSSGYSKGRSSVIKSQIQFTNQTKVTAVISTITSLHMLQ